MPDRPLILGTRGSPLALAQTELAVAALHARHPALPIAVRTFVTQGDARRDLPLRVIGGQGVFVKAIEEALLAGQIDAAVHSLKDVPGELRPGCLIAAVLPRGDARDVLVARDHCRLLDLPAGARVGTSSARRAAQIRALRPDLVPLDIRGNVETRLRKLDQGEYEAVVLAAAGLERLGLAERVTEYLAVEAMLPSPGQGAIALEARADDQRTLALLRAIDHLPTRQAVTAERAFLRGMGGGCRLPLAAYATVDGELLHLRALVADPAGQRVIRTERCGPAAAAADLGRAVAQEILSAGAVVLLEGATV